MFPVHTNAPRPKETPSVIALLAAMTLVFFYQQMLPAWDNLVLMTNWGFIPAIFSARAGPAPDLQDWVRPISAAFLHGGWFHFVLNAWTFWLFGRAVEGSVGAKRMLGLFIATAVLANLGHLLVYPGDPTVVVGASGAISGIIGAHLRLFPDARVLLVVPIVVVPIWFRVRAIYFISVWFAIQLFQGLGAWSDPQAGAGVAWWVHIAGFVVGFAAAAPLARGRPLPFRPASERTPVTTPPGQHETWRIGPWGSRPSHDEERG